MTSCPDLQNACMVYFLAESDWPWMLLRMAHSENSNERGNGSKGKGRRKRQVLMINNVCVCHIKEKKETGKRPKRLSYALL